MKFLGGKSVLDDDTDRSFRNAIFIGTPVLVLYNVLVMSGFVDSHVYQDPLVSGMVSVLWLLLSMYVYFSRGLSLKHKLANLALYHFFAIATIVFIAGFTSPFTPLISILILISFTNYGTFVAALSGLSIFAAATTSLLLTPEFSVGILSSLTSTILLGLVGIAIARNQEKKHRNLEKSQAREKIQHRQMSTIINNLTDATLTISPTGRVLMYNAACLDILDTNSSIKGKSIDKIFKTTFEDGREVTLMSILKDAKKATTRDDLLHVYSGNDKINLELTFAPIKSSFEDKSSSKTGYIMIIRDITKKKTLDEDKDEFISVISHELRTPVAIAEGTLSNIELLLSRKDKTDPKILSSTVKTAHDQIMYLSKMVNDLSTLSRAERGVGDEPESISVKDIINTTYNRYQQQALEKKLKLDLDMGHNLGSVFTSRLYLEELLQNFVTNAIKYTKEGTVTIICRRENNKINFAVKDTGIGISKTDQDKIFNKFYRSEDYRTRETGGTGLGLYVASKLASKINTKISLTSRLNHGSTFSFELPVEVVDPSK